MLGELVKVVIISTLMIGSVSASDKLKHELFLDQTFDNATSLKRYINEDIDYLLEHLKNSKEFVDDNILETKGEFNKDREKHIKNYKKIKQNIIKLLNNYEIK